MKKDTKKALYENIMTSVAKEVKKVLNEYGDWTITTTLGATSWNDDQTDSDFVDLGLSVKWAKYNLGATPGKRAEDWYGEYYAWGETKPKSKYAQNNYKFLNRSNDFVKYNDDDHITVLTSKDDAASISYKGKMRIPIKEELEELMTLSNQWVKNYNGIEGLNGKIFKGKNGNTLFIPAAGFKVAGYRDGDTAFNAECGCYLWSSSLYLDHIDAALISFFDPTHNNIGQTSRYYGLSIRAILA